MLLESTCYRSYLGDELSRRIRLNPRYSLRAFALQLGLSPGELSEILRGKRRLSLKSVAKISAALDLTPAEGQHLIALLQKETAPTQAEGKEIVPEKSSLTIEFFNLVSEWYHFAILNLALCDSFRNSERWIARKLGLSLPQVHMALRRLERVGLVKRDKGRIKVVKDYVVSPDGIPSEAIRNYHRAILQKAADSLETQNLEERDITGITLPIDPKEVGAIKKEISDFLETISRRVARSKRKSEVYQLEVTLFRLTRNVVEVKES